MASISLLVHYTDIMTKLLPDLTELQYVELLLEESAFREAIQLIIPARQPSVKTKKDIGPHILTEENSDDRWQCVCLVHTFMLMKIKLNNYVRTYVKDKSTYFMQVYSYST